MVKTRIHDDQGVDEDFLSEKELNDFFETVVITGTNGRDDTELITTFDGYFPGRGLITAGSGIIVTTGTNFVEITRGPDTALTGSDGITIVSGTSAIDIQGFRTEFVSASGSLQDQIGTGGVTSLNSLAGVVDIIGKGEVVVTIEGQNVVISGTPHVATSGGGTTPGSGTATTISGCFTHVQNSPADVWNINHNLFSEPVNYITINSNNTEIIPDTFTINDFNNVTITFVSPQAGKAHIFPCISGSTIPDPLTVGTLIVTDSLTISGVPVSTGTGGGSGDGTITDINDQPGPSITVTGTGGVSVTASGNVITIDGAGVNTATVSGCFTHVQSTASDTWNVNHNLASGPVNYIVVNDSDFEVIPDNFKINDSDNVTITFVAPQSGKAHIFPCISGGIGAAPVGGGGGTQALIGTDGITVISGSSFDNIQGFQTEFVLASGSLQDQLDATVSGINDVFAVRLDEVDQTTYVGEAAPGSLDASAVWRIKRMIETGPDIAITWAAGTSDFNAVWDDRLILSYS